MKMKMLKMLKMLKILKILKMLKMMMMKMMNDGYHYTRCSMIYIYGKYQIHNLYCGSCV